jgi:protein-L-isoaspartate(D-aspartate) O-methyltransferase
MEQSGDFTEAELAVVRRAFAKQVMAAARVADPRVEAAFAAIRREDFLGPGPWPMIQWPDRYIATPSADPTYLYIDSIVGILPERHINNGQPSLHAALIARAAPQRDAHVVHIGAGAGYYSAILAHAVGPLGRVTAIELDPGLAERARANLSPFLNVRVVEGDGATVPFEEADIVYVNAGATRPADAWLDRLAEGGRLILPLTSNKGFMHNDPPVAIERRGAVFLIERGGTDFLATWISPVAIFPCEGMRDAESEAALAASFAKGGWERVKRLRRTADLPEDECWLRAPGWSLTYR